MQERLIQRNPSKRNYLFRLPFFAGALLEDFLFVVLFAVFRFLIAAIITPLV